MGSNLQGFNMLSTLFQIKPFLAKLVYFKNKKRTKKYNNLLQTQFKNQKIWSIALFGNNNIPIPQITNISSFFKNLIYLNKLFDS